MAADCDRPLYLSVYIEVWISKEGHIQLNSTEELLSEYLNKEKEALGKSCWGRKNWWIPTCVSWRWPVLSVNLTLPTDMEMTI